MNLYEPIAKAVLFVALMLMAGAPATAISVARPVLRAAGYATDVLNAPLRKLLAIASACALLGSLGLFIAQVIPLELEFTTFNEWREFVLGTTLGTVLLWRVGLCVFALLGLMAVRGDVGLWLCAGLGVACYATLTRTSHTFAKDAGAWLIAADFAHLIAGGLWGGGLAVLAMTMPLILRNSDDATAAQITARLIRRFSPLGIVGVALVSSTGLWLSARHISEAGKLATTLYGNVLVVKVLGVLAAGVLAGLHKFVAQRNMHSRANAITFARSVRLEAAIVIAVFFAAALLTSAPPAHETQTPTQTDLFHRLLMTSAGCIVVAGGIALAVEARQRKNN